DPEHGAAFKTLFGEAGSVCDLSAAEQGIVEVNKHQNETGNDNNSRKPAEGVGHANFLDVHKFTVHEDFSEREACRQPSTINPIIHNHETEEAQHEQNNNRNDQTKPQFAHVRATSLRNDNKRHSHQA